MVTLAPPPERVARGRRCCARRSCGATEARALFPPRRAAVLARLAAGSPVARRGRARSSGSRGVSLRDPRALAARWARAHGDCAGTRGARALPHEPGQGSQPRRRRSRWGASLRRPRSRVRGRGQGRPAAKEARSYVERDPEDAAKAEAAAKRGPRINATVDELVAKGHSVIERVRPMVARLRARFGRK